MKLVRGEMPVLGSELRGELAGVRDDMTTQLPKLIAANLAGGVGIAGLVFAAARFA